MNRWYDRVDVDQRCLRVQMKPVAGHIDGCPQLEEQRPFRIEHRQDKAQTHRRTSVNQHVEHGPELRT